jgi:hypothetical protein
MAPRYSIQLGRWVEDDEDARDELDASELDGPNPFDDEPQGDMEVGPIEMRQAPTRVPSLAEVRRPMPGEMGENPRLPERHPELSNEETQGYEQKASELGLGDLATTPGVPKTPRWETTSLDEAKRLDDMPQESPFEPAKAPEPDRNPLYPVAPSTLRHTASTEQASDEDLDGGKRRDVMGIETEDPDPPEKRQARVAELYNARYGDEAPQQESPFEPYQNQGERVSPEDMQRMWMFNVIGGGADQGFKAMDLARGMNQDYDRRNHEGRQDHVKNWMAEHEARSQSGHLSQAEAELGVNAGWFSPEAAMSARRGVLKTGGQIGALAQRDRATEAKLMGKEIDVLGKAHETAKKQDFEGREGAARDLTTRRGQDANMRLLEAKQSQAQDVSGAYKLQSIMETADVDRARAQEILNGGDTSDLKPSVQRKLQSTMLANEVVGTDAKAMVRGSSQMLGNNTRQKDSLEAKAADPKETARIRNEYASTEQSLRDARDGLAELRKDPMALAAFVKLGSTGNLNELANFGRTPEQQAAASKIYRVLNNTVRKEGGKALSKSELEMWGAGSGVTIGSGTNVFRSPEVLIEYLKSLDRARVAYKKNISRSYGPEFWSQ